MRIGLAGLGAASTDILRALDNYGHIDVTAGCDVRPDARLAFEQIRGGIAFGSVEAMAKSDVIDAIYVATPNHLHCEHVLQAVANGKDVIVEKPIAITIAECDVMVRAAERTGRRILAGHTHSFDAPVVAMADLISKGVIGDVHLINQSYYTDWMFRGRVPNEVNTALGGGVVFRQGPHGIDIVRLLAQRPATRVTARTTQLFPRHPTHGSYVAMIEFGPKLVATVIFSGYGFFDTAELAWGRGEMGAPRSLGANSESRGRILAFKDAAEEEEYKNACRFAGGEAENWGAVFNCEESDRAQPFYGLTIVSGSKGDIRQSEHGLYLYDDNGRQEIAVAKAPTERDAELDIMYKAWRDDVPLKGHDAAWARDTLKIILAIIESHETGKAVDIL